MSWGAALGSAFGSVLNFGSSMSAQQNQSVLARQNEDMQREFAQNGIRWKAEDARAAGIHPLFAMGASTHSFTPVSVGGGSSFDYASSLGNMGQNIDRAINAGKTNDERLEALHETAHQRSLQTERMQLENTFLRTQIQRSLSQVGPPLPRLGQTSPGGGNSGDVMAPSGHFAPTAPEVHNPNPVNPGTTAGPSAPSVTWVQNSFGALQPYPDKNLKVEDEFGAPLMARWALTEALPHNWRSNNIPENLWRERFPGAVGVEWSYRNQGYVPIYPKDVLHRSRDTRESIHYGGNTPSKIHPYSRYPRTFVY